MNPILPVRRSRLLGGYVCSICTRQLRRPTRSYATAAAAKPDIYDVVCVGGGPAGLSLLAALRMLPLQYSPITHIVHD
jgi:ubiquinone biosynthesis monooxygenase Coq6